MIPYVRSPLDDVPAPPTRSRRAQSVFDKKRAQALAAEDTSVLTRARLNAGYTIEELADATVQRSSRTGEIVASVSVRTIARMEAGGRDAACVDARSWALVCDVLGRSRRQLDPSFVA